MQITSLLGHSAELTRIIRKSSQPADVIASEFFRSKKYIGASDRRFISGLVFHTLRTLSLCEAVADHEKCEDVVHAGHLLMEPGEHDLSWIADLPEHVRACTQDWLLASTRTRWSDAADVWKSMTQAAPMVLRVNLRRVSRERVLRHLHSDNIDAVEGPLSPAAVVVNQRVNLLQHPLFKGGIVEVQDEGSQLVGYACDPGQDDVILDACAGAGGKSLQLADLQMAKGQIVANDIEWNRLKEIAPRAHRAGVLSITVERRQPGSAARDNRLFDLVLVDAPCSGLGTARRMPMAKWRITPDTLARHARKQRQVLEEYVSHVRPGGVLVYATCSIMPEENERVVEKFLANHPEFTGEPLAPCFERHGVNVPGLAPEQFMLQVDPLHHGTDGLFMARMRRTAM
ncbi:MAG: RsmB/NOP family class I SAM-dependent RNA methyltransferase [Candidatus Kapabacteria bacterium]|nr:RsmB/NOP family class I SAM-dependent RNA methyltransferase [Candidatus Kapabacteria bacterium]